MATTQNPVTTLDARFSSPDATATSWEQARNDLEQAEIYWLTTVRPDGRPHVTPLIAIWQDEALHFATGPGEQKAKNLASNAHCIITTGCNHINEGLDLVIEGEAAQVQDEARLQRLANSYKSKYDWDFTVREGALYNDQGGEALVYAIVPRKVLGFGKGETFSQTRWRF
jgi:general stress protein 26